jgi:exosortase
MTTEAAVSPSRPPRAGIDWRQPWLPLFAGLLAIALPTIINLGGQTWSTDLGAHGPIVLATGLWLLHYEGLTLAAARAATPWRPIVPLLVVAFVSYALARAYDFISIEVFALYLFFIAFLIRLYGFAQVKRWAFPLLYLAFIIPIPGWLLDVVTQPLQLFVSTQAAHLTEALGYPVARRGVVLEVAQYQMFVEDACAGMNSLVGLTAVSLFYIYLLRKASWRYALVLVALILPIAVFVNIVRVLCLILITYHLGDEAAQGFMHGGTGMALFAMALVVIFGVDMLLLRLQTRFAR